MTTERQEPIDRVAGLLEVGNVVAIGKSEIYPDGLIRAVPRGGMFGVDVLTFFGWGRIGTHAGARECAEQFAESMTTDELRAAIEAAERTDNGKV